MTRTLDHQKQYTYVDVTTDPLYGKPDDEGGYEIPSATKMLTDRHPAHRAKA
jgi:hypothetical protein